MVSGIHNFDFLYTKITWPLGWKIDLKRTKTLFPPYRSELVKIGSIVKDCVVLCFLCANNS